MSMYNLIDQFNNAGSKWFSTSNMRFHRTRILHGTFTRLTDGRAMFITSDRTWNDGRAYSVRLAGWRQLEEGGSVPSMETIEPSNAIPTRAEAMKILRAEARRLNTIAAGMGR